MIRNALIALASVMLVCLMGLQVDGQVFRRGGYSPYYPSQGRLVAAQPYYGGQAYRSQANCTCQSQQSQAPYYAYSPSQSGGVPASTLPQTSVLRSNSVPSGVRYVGYYNSQTGQTYYQPVTNANQGAVMMAPQVDMARQSVPAVIQPANPAPVANVAPVLTAPQIQPVAVAPRVSPATKPALLSPATGTQTSQPTVGSTAATPPIAATAPRTIAIDTPKGAPTPAPVQQSTGEKKSISILESPSNEGDK